MGIVCHAIILAMSQPQEKTRALTFFQAQEYMRTTGPAVARLLLCGKKEETAAVLGYIPDVNAAIDALTPSEVEWVHVLNTANAQEKTMLWYAAVVTTLSELSGYQLQSLVASWPVEFLVVLPYVAQFKAHRKLDLTEEEEIYAIEQGAADYDELFAMFSMPDFIYEEDPIEEASETTLATVYWLSVMMKLPLQEIVLFSTLAEKRIAASAA